MKSMFGEYGLEHYFSMLDIFSALICLTILLVITNMRRANIEDPWLSRMYNLNVIYKLGFALIFALFYIFIVQGGDTLAYWRTADITLEQLFYSPAVFFENINSEPTWTSWFQFYNGHTGYPPSFIYREPESFFVAKVTMFVGLLTFKSYFATTFIFAYLFAQSSWKIFTYCIQFDFIDKKLFALLFLFLPSVAFWCSGVSKDGLALIALFYITYYLLILIDQNKKLKFLQWLSLIFFVYILINIRSFILISIVAPFLMVLLRRYMSRLDTNNVSGFFFKFAVNLSLIGVIVFSFLFIGKSNLAESSSTIQNAAIIQSDFSTNNTYGDLRYDLGEVEFSLIGILKSFPLATLTGIYRPFLWEARSLTLLFNGIESILLIYLTIKLLISKPLKRISFIRKQDILVFAFIFILCIGFMAGFTSIIFGVLVRIRAPLLPFLGLLLAIDWKNVNLTPKAIN